MRFGRAVIVGPVPTIVHGQSIATEYVIGLLTHLSPKVVDTARRRLASHAKAAAAILVAGSVYLSVNSKRGICLTIALAFLAALLRKPLVLHHHSYERIGRYSHAMGLLVLLAGRRAVHLVQGRRMCRDMKARYPAARIKIFSNVGAVALLPSPARTGPLTFGHMGNLSKEKGITQAIDILRAIPHARLVVAGRADRFAAAAIRNAHAEFGERFEWLGPVYGSGKQAFFDAIDVFLFPSAYSLETQGIVNLEALAAGKPVVAFARGCIADEIGTTGGIVVPVGGDFTAVVMRYVASLPRDSASVRARFEELLAKHAAERQALVRLLTPGNVRHKTARACASFPGPEVSTTRE